MKIRPIDYNMTATLITPLTKFLIKLEIKVQHYLMTPRFQCIFYISYVKTILHLVILLSVQYKPTKPENNCVMVYRAGSNPRTICLTALVYIVKRHIKVPLSKATWGAQALLRNSHDTCLPFLDVVPEVFELMESKFSGAVALDRNVKENKEHFPYHVYLKPYTWQWGSTQQQSSLNKLYSEFCRSHLKYCIMCMSEPFAVINKEQLKKTFVWCQTRQLAR